MFSPPPWPGPTLPRMNVLLRRPVLLLVVTFAAVSAWAAPTPPRDPLAAAIERWAAKSRDTTSDVPMTRDTRKFVQPVITGAETALHDGRRLLALYRLAYAWGNLGAADY